MKEKQEGIFKKYIYNILKVCIHHVYMVHVHIIYLFIIMHTCTYV